MVNNWKYDFGKWDITKENLFKEVLLIRKTKSQLINIIVNMKRKHQNLKIYKSDIFDLYESKYEGKEIDDEEYEEDDDGEYEYVIEGEYENVIEEDEDFYEYRPKGYNYRKYN
ncbi:hypothetical protein ACTA71_005054 [Dictyostelium dimigraforme]